MRARSARARWHHPGRGAMTTRWRRAWPRTAASDEFIDVIFVMKLGVIDAPVFFFPVLALNLNLDDAYH